MALLLKGLKIGATHFVLSDIGSWVGSWHMGLGVGGAVTHRLQSGFDFAEM